METHELLKITTDLGYFMLKHGAEVYRVEESINYILAAYGCERSDVFAIPTYLIVSITDNSGVPYTKMRRIHDRTTDLDKVDKLNNLCRHICRKKPKFNSAKRLLTMMMNQKVYPQWIYIFATALSAGMFTLFFNGNLYDAGVSFIIGVIIRLVQIFLTRLKANSFFSTIISSFIIGSVALMSVYIGIGVNYDKIIIGAIMPLVPGLILTNCMRDFIVEDYMAGVLRMIEALLISVGIAVGIAISLMFFQRFM